MKHLFLVVASLLWASILFVNAQPSASEIAAALDDNPGNFLWEWKSTGGATLEVVEDSAARGGSALKLTVPDGAECSLSRIAAIDFGFFRFQAKSDELGIDELLTPYTEDSIHSIEPEDAGQWQLVSGRHMSRLPHAIKLVDTVSSHTRVLYLDSVQVVPGAGLQIETFGMDVAMMPDLASFPLGSWVELAATPSKEDKEFLYWEGLPDPRADRHEAENGFRINEHINLRAVGAQRYEMADFQVLVPLNQEVSVFNRDASHMSVDLISGGSDLLLRGTGPGMITFTAEHLPGVASGKFFVGGNYVGPDPTEVCLFFEAGEFTHGLACSSRLRLSNLHWVDAVPLTVSVLGGGEVSVGDLATVSATQTVEERVGANSEIRLTATAYDGWEFDHWEGCVYSDESGLTLHVADATSLKAVFRRPLDFAAIESHYYMGRPWTVDTSTGEEEIVGPEFLFRGLDSSLVWTLDGPGLLEFSYQKSSSVWSKLLVDGVHVQDLERYEGNEKGEVSLSFDAYGTHTVEFMLMGHSIWEENPRLRLSDIQWTPGFEVTVAVEGEGEVTGAESSQLLAVGSELSLTAVADEGYHFDGWTGSVVSDENPLVMTVASSLDFVGQFSRTVDLEVSDHPWVERLSGSVAWEYDTNSGSWTLPVGMTAEECALIEGRVEGLARITIEVSAHDGEPSENLAFMLDGEFLRNITSGENSFKIPAGVHHYAIQATGGEGNSSAYWSVTDPELSYFIDLHFVNCGLDSTPELSTDYYGVDYSGWVEAGTSWSYAVSGYDGSEFLGWSGDMEGEEQSGELLIEQSIEAEAVMGYPEVELAGISFSVSDPASIYKVTRQYDELGFSGESEEIALEGDVSGPMMFVFRNDSLDSCELLLDDAVLDPIYGGFANYYFIPSGEHHLVWRMRANLSGALIKYPQTSVNHGASRIFAESGYMVETKAFGAGVVGYDPQNTLFQAGEEVTVSAIANEGNRLLYWEAPYEAKSASFSALAEDEIRAVAHFGANELLGGIVFDYEGMHPSYSADSYFSNRGGALVYYLSSGSPEVSTLSFQVEGEGLLSIPVDVSKSWDVVLSHLNLKLLVDEVEYSVDAESIVENALEVPLSAGSHEVQVQISSELEEDQFMSLYLGLPSVRKVFNVSASAEYAEVSYSPVKDVYAYGEAIQLSAPATDTNGDVFLGWWSSDLKNFFSPSREWSMEVAADLDVVAAYGPVDVGVDGVSMLFISGDSAVSLGTSDDSPEKGMELINSARNWRLRLGVEEAGTVFFANHTDQGRGQFFVYDQTGDEMYEHSFDEGWNSCQVYLRAGASIDLFFKSVPELYHSLADLRFEKAWHPTLFGASETDFDFDPSLDSLAMGESAEVVIPDRSQHRFYGWYVGDDPDDWDFSSREVVRGESSVLYPKWVNIEFPDGVRFKNPMNGWISGYINNGGLNWRSFWGETDVDEERSLEFQLEGPGCAEFSLSSYSSGGPDSLIVICVDGEPVEYVWQDKIQIPAGNHRLSITHRASGRNHSLDVRGFTYQPGVYLESREYDGGSVDIDGDRGYYLPNGKVLVEAVPDEGYAFSHWQAPFEKQVRSFYPDLAKGYRPVPVFEELGEEFDAFGLHWTTGSVSVVPDTEKTLYEVSGSSEKYERVNTILKVSNSSENGRLTGLVRGPCVLVIDRSWDWEECLLDGIPVSNSSVLSMTHSMEDDREGDLYIAIPSGNHLFTQLIDEWWATDHYLSGVRRLPGALVSVKGLGIAVSKSNDSWVQPLGTKLELEAELGDVPAQLEWLGLPSAAVVDGNRVKLTVSGHLDVEAAVWNPMSMGGLQLLHAGSGSWVPGYNDKMNLDFIRNRGHDRIRYIAGAAGAVRYTFTRNVTGRVYRNGDLLKEGIGVSRMDGLVWLGRAGDVLEWVFDPDLVYADDFNRTSWPLVFDELAWIGAEDDFQPYLSWMKGFVDSGATSMDPEKDLDGDGIPNYLEYRMGKNPLLRDPELGIGLRRSRQGVDLVFKVPVNTEVSDFAVECAVAPNGPWLDAEDYLEPIRNEGGLTLRKLSEGILNGKGLFFRVHYIGDETSDKVFEE